MMNGLCGPFPAMDPLAEVYVWGEPVEGSGPPITSCSGPAPPPSLQMAQSDSESAARLCVIQPAVCADCITVGTPPEPISNVLAMDSREFTDAPESEPEPRF